MGRSGIKESCCGFFVAEPNGTEETMNLTRIEFYERCRGMIDACRAASVPRQGEYVNIAKKQWRVAYVAWALDDPDGLRINKELRANVELESVPDDEVRPID
jgi:hypothetical protein